MEERRQIRRERVTVLHNSDYLPVNWKTIIKLDVPETDDFISLKVEKHEQKVWDDEAGTVFRDHWTLRTSYFSPETDKEFIERVKVEQRTAEIKKEREQAEKDAEYLTYLRLKAMYDDRKEEISEDPARSLEHGD